jgi:hypothetical protein
MSVMSIRPIRSPQFGERSPLFPEITETAETRDAPFIDGDGSWGTKPQAPNGDRWTVEDFSDERRTKWTRTRLVPSRGRP